MRHPSPAIPYEIRRSDRARRVRVNVHPIRGSVEVVLPASASSSDAATAIASLRAWIGARQEEAAGARAALAARGDRLPYLGEALRVVPEAGRRSVARRGDALLVPAAEMSSAIERWYRRRARAEIEPRLDDIVARLGAAYRRLRIAGQRTRWGSCSADATLSFNWRLLLAPEPVLEYVIWHEACHLLVMDHSPSFWALVEENLPGYRRQRDWLRAKGPTLVL
jgi:predicted metal-dependent hydrolase